MASGRDLVVAAERFLGQPYSTAPGRDDPGSGHKDCSGLVAAAYLVATGRPLGANVSVTIFDLAVRHGLEISREEAIVTAGACLLIPDDPYQGWGARGHIGISDGEGGTVEATPPRVMRLPVSFQRWGPRACLLPGIDYGAAEDGAAEEDGEMDMIWCESDPDHPGMACALVRSGGLIVFESVAPPGFAGIPNDPWLNAFVDGENAFGGGRVSVRRKVNGDVIRAARSQNRLVSTGAGDRPGLDGVSSQELLAEIARRLP